MKGNIFFSFHYENDLWRARQARNALQAGSAKKALGFCEPDEWKDMIEQGFSSMKTWIDKQILSSSSTLVLIGHRTSELKYVSYAIKKTLQSGKNLVGVDVHRIKNSKGRTSPSGENPFQTIFINLKGKKTYISDIFPTYEWVKDDGYKHLSSWIDGAEKINLSVE